jgi:hypothetical protein
MHDHPGQETERSALRERSAALRELVAKWREESRKDYAIRHDDDSGGIWAYQHEASGRWRKASQCADELEALIEREAAASLSPQPQRKDQE